MSNGLVDAFNALPQAPTITSQRVPNEWHFNLRFMRRLPTSSLFLIILQPQAKFIHIANLPLCIDTSPDKPAADLEYFLETYQEAAPDIVKMLRHFFVNILRHGGASKHATLAPWRLITRDKTLANAVGAELKRQGVYPLQLCDVGVACAGVNAVADAQAKKLVEDSCEGDERDQIFSGDCFPDSVSLLQSTPNPCIPGGYNDLEGPARYACMARHYGAMLARGAPPDGGPYYGPKSLIKEHNRLAEIQQLLMNSPGHAVKSAADLGDASAALNYSIRLSLGLDCEPSRKLSRVYLAKAADSETASDKTKATAHGLLVFWYFDSSITEMVPIHFLYAACHHANLAAFFCERVSPPNSPSCPAVVWLMDWVLNVDEEIPWDIHMMFPNVFVEDEQGDARIRKLDPWSLKRRFVDRPHKYFCAAVDCEIQVDFAHALSECAGRCDKDKKPSYCSWQCQKANWAVHKPFCRPGARRSCVPDSSMRYSAYGDRTAPTLRITTDPLDEDTPDLRSYTLSAAQLKALRPFSENPVRLQLPVREQSRHPTKAMTVEIPAQTSNEDDAKLEPDNSDRQCCAATTCPIEIGARQTLPECAGPCDMDTKAIYCSTTCLQSDWKMRTARCRAGAPCSVMYPECDTDILKSASPRSAFSEETSISPDSLTSFSSEDTLGMPISCQGYTSPQSSTKLEDEMAFYPTIGALGLLSFFLFTG